MSFDYGARMGRARALMAEQRIDAMLLSIGPDLPYFTGYEAMASERLTMGVVPVSGDPVLAVPRLEAPRVDAGSGAFSVRPWDETERPEEIVAGLIPGSIRVAVGDHTRAVFLMRLQALLPGTEFVSATEISAALRILKEPAEVACLREAAEAADRVTDRIGSLQFAGRTERDIGRDVAAMTVEEGHDVATFAIVASGPNGASPHHEPGDRVIEPGEAVVIDFGGRVAGYHSDTTRNFVVGDAGDEYREASTVLRRAQDEAVEAVRPGVPAGDVDLVARSIIAEAGFGDYFVHRTGHGIGLDVHEEPYLVEGNDLLLEPGMTFSVEPGIYLAGRFGVRIEDIVAVTETGVERLNQAPRDPVRVA